MKEKKFSNIMYIDETKAKSSFSLRRISAVGDLSVSGKKARYISGIRNFEMRKIFDVEIKKQRLNLGSVVLFAIVFFIIYIIFSFVSGSDMETGALIIETFGQTAVISFAYLIFNLIDFVLGVSKWIRVRYTDGEGEKRVAYFVKGMFIPKLDDLHHALKEAETD